MWAPDEREWAEMIVEQGVEAVHPHDFSDLSAYARLMRDLDPWVRMEELG